MTTQPKPLGTLRDICGKCGVEVEATVWPYMRGGTGRHGEALVWYRCPSCARLFSTLAQRESTLQGSEATRHEQNRPGST